MESMGYDNAEEQFQQKSRRRCIIIIVALIVLAVLLMGAVLGSFIHKSSPKSNSVRAANSLMIPPSSLRAVCSVTEYPDSCFSSISSLKSVSNSTNPEHFFKLSLQVAFNELSNVFHYPTKLLTLTNDTGIEAALTVCLDLLEDALDRLNDSISSYENIEGENTKKIHDIRTWLSTTIIDQETCLDGLREFNHTLAQDVEKVLKNSTVFASNSLAIVTNILGILFQVDNMPIHRTITNLLGKHDDEFPDWVGFSEQGLLHEANPMPNVTVAKDGTGNYKTIKEAVDSVPPKLKATRRYVIYVKEGVYEENVNLDKSKWNVMIYGDGKNKTIVSGKLSRDDGIPTSLTATFAALGKGFIARDIGFRNTAGAAKHQAVAFHSKSDMSVCYRCSFDAFQDTLYVHSDRQFYRDCDIIGTIDFIFGHAAVVIQNCNILPRQPLSNQLNIITAHGYMEGSTLQSGIAIHKCAFAPYDNLTAPTYLGRPWKNHSTTIIMQSTIGSFLNPLGWIDWNLTGVDEPTSQIYFAEYQNTGPGSSVAHRVKWRGYKPNITENDAAKFTVGTFINGSDWLPATNVTFNASLSEH